MKSGSVKAHCPNCDGERTCVAHGCVDVPWEWHDDYGNTVTGGSKHSLLQCGGCETVFYERADWDSESVDYHYDSDGNTVIDNVETKITYPKPEPRNKPRWVNGEHNLDARLREILNQMYLANDQESYILASIGLRTALDRATEVLGIDTAMPFAKKLDELRSRGWIGDTERDILSVVTEAGNAAVHRAWSPEREEMQALILALEVFLQKAFIVGKSALALSAKIPKKAKPAPSKPQTR